MAAMRRAKRDMSKCGVVCERWVKQGVYTGTLQYFRGNEREGKLESASQGPNKPSNSPGR